jgi:predicted porin
MQKKIIALAVAGLVSGVAFAQTNVTVYGVIDQSYTYSSSNAFGQGTNKFSGLKDGGLSGTRFGFKGEEALGNGLKAIFTLEYGKDGDNNSDVSNFFTRQSFVGLTNNYGTLTLGRQYNASSDVYGQNSSNGVVNAMPVNAFQGALGSQIRSQGGTARQDNVIKYVSPTFSGFSVRGSYAFGEDGKTYSDPTIGVGDDGRFAIAGSYANGPFGVDLSYAGTSKAHKAYTGVVTNAGGVGSAVAGSLDNVNEWYIGGRYDFKVVKVYASYQDLDNKTDVVNANTGSKMWQVGLSAPVGANGVAQFEYAEIRFDADNYRNLGTAANPTVRADGKNKGFGIGYQHNLSKRTTLYTYLTQLKYDANTGSTSDWIGGIAAAGEKTNTFSAGVRHTF